MSRRPRKEWIYLVKSGNAVKIGRTTRLEDRVKALQTGSPYTLTIIRAFPVVAHLAAKVESSVRAHMAAPMQGEWVEWQPGIERIADGVVAGHLGGGGDE